MARALVVLSLVMLVAASLQDEHLVERIEIPLGGIIPLSQSALQSDETLRRVELALQQLSNQNGGLFTHRVIKIRSGTSQVVNGFKLVFIVEVESVPTEDATPANRVSEVYEIKIYEPAGTNPETKYSFRKISSDEN